MSELRQMIIFSRSFRFWGWVMERIYGRKRLIW